MVADGIRKACARHIIHRFLGRFLERQLALDQLSLNLTNGKVEVEQISLNTQILNDTFTRFNIPLVLLDGYIGKISMEIPWYSLMSNATRVTVEELQLTIHTKERLNLEDKDLVASMIGSVVGSLVSSEELANSIYLESRDHDVKEIQDEGIAAFTKVIDAIYSRFCIDFNDTTVRIESVSADDSEMCTGIEFRIDSIRFMDEQMRTCEQDQHHTGSITSQPHGMGSITNLNKFVVLNGVTLYTDVFSKISDLETSDVLITSMHIRREKLKKQSPTRSPQSSLHPDLYMSTMSNTTAFQSCYASLIPDGNPFNTPDSKVPEPELFSNPVKFAEISGETTIVVRVQNSNTTLYTEKTSSAHQSKAEVEVYFNGLNVFLTPSQIYILQNFVRLASITEVESPRANGKLMGKEDYEAMINNIEETTCMMNKVQSNGMVGGNWNRNEEYHEFHSISLNDPKAKQEQEDSIRDSLKVTSQREEVSLTAKFGTFLCCIPHFDHLSHENIQKREGYQGAIIDLQDESNKFFEFAKDVSFSSQVPLEDIRSEMDQLYNEDHIRITASSIRFTYTLKRIPGMENMVAKAIFTKFDALEYLTSKSVPGSIERLHIPLLNFEKMENPDNDPHLKLVATCSTESKLQMKIEAFVSPCESEFDLSMVDRIADLIATRPFFERKFADPLRREPPPLREDLFAPTTSEEEKASACGGSTLEFFCGHWDIKIAVPKADLRDLTASRHPYNERHVHPESLHLSLRETSVSIPRELDDVFAVSIICAELHGSLQGIPNVCTEDEQFLFAGGSERQQIKIKVEYDPRTKAVKTEPPRPVMSPEDMIKSISSPIVRSQVKREGPFSQTPRSFVGDDHEKIVQAGTRKEMLAFQETCQKMASLNLYLSFPVLRFRVPEKDNLEVLYNRLANDLALWQPAAPGLRKAADEVKINALETYHECSVQRDESDVSDTEEEPQSGLEEQEDFDRSLSHVFCATVKVAKGTVLCSTLVRENNVVVGKGQVAFEVIDAQVGTTAGYHGDLNHTFFFLTSKKTSVGSTNAPRFPTYLNAAEFGRWKRDDGKMEYVDEHDELSSGSQEDSFAVALHMHSRTDANVKDVLLCIAVRNSLFYARPFQDLGHFWGIQLMELFTLVDDVVPGYEMPVVTNDVHLNLEDVIVGYDHIWINPESSTRLRAVLGQCNLSSAVTQSMNVSKSLCILESAKLFMASGSAKESVRFGGESRTSRPKTYFQVVDIGLVQLEVLFCMAKPENNKHNLPLFEVRCKNDVIQVWACADSLAMLVTVAVEISSSDKIKPMPAKEGSPPDQTISETDDGTQSEAGESCWSQPQSVRKPRNGSGNSLPEHVERHIQEVIEDAVKDRKPNSIPVGRDALEEFAIKTRPGGKDLLTSAIEELEPPTRKFTNTFDEEFCMVDDNVLGSGITNVAGEARVRYVGSKKTEDDSGVNLNVNHFAVPDEWKADGLPQLPPGHPKPIMQCLLRELTVKIHLYGGSDLSKVMPKPKSYSTDNYREGRGRGQSIEPRARGGPHRDHSVAVTVELTKITLMHQIYDKAAMWATTTLFSIGDAVVRDRVHVSDIKEMLYLYETPGMPRRTSAPLLAVRLAANQKSEGKIRISLQPIKINVDQDTLEFLTDFFEEISKLVDLPLDSSAAMQERPVMEVPAEIRNAAAASISSRNASATPLVGRLYPTLSGPSLSVEPLTPSPVAPPSPLEDFSYLERGSNHSSPSKRAVYRANLTASAVSIGDMFASPQSKRAVFNKDESPQTGTSSEGSSPDLVKADPNAEDDEETDMTGDWSSDVNISKALGDLLATPARQISVDDLLSRSTMDGSVHPCMVQSDLIDTSSDIEECDEDHGNFLNSEGEVSLDESSTPKKEDLPSISKRSASRECTVRPDEPKEEGEEDNLEEELGRQQIFYKNFVFSPETAIYVDYHGKRKISMEKAGALIGLLMAFGQLNQMPIALKELQNRNGMLGLGRCLNYALSEWINDMMTNMPSVIASCGPISPLVQIGKGFMDLFWMPMEEMRKEDGRVVKGIQKGVGSFGLSSAAGIVGMAQTVAGFVQTVAEMTMNEVNPDGSYRRGRRFGASGQVPADIRHSLQLAYGTIYQGYRQTRDDLELVAQEDRISGNSAVRSAFRYAVPTFLGPIVMASQITYQLLGGLRNQLRPDICQDERRKWGDEDVPGGSG